MAFFTFSIQLSKMNDNYGNFYSIVGFVKISKIRTGILNSINTGFKMPSEIARELDKTVNCISNYLRDLRKANLVFCINEDFKKGRFYRCTDLGLMIIDFLDDLMLL